MKVLTVVLKFCIWCPSLWPWKSPTLLPPLTSPMSSRSCCSYHTRPCFCPRAFAQVVSSVRTPSPWYLHDLLHHFLLTNVTLSVRSLLTTLFKMASSHLSLALCVSVSALLLCMSFITIDICLLACLSSRCKFHEGRDFVHCCILSV